MVRPFRAIARPVITTALGIALATFTVQNAPADAPALPTNFQTSSLQTSPEFYFSTAAQPPARSTAVNDAPTSLAVRSAHVTTTTIADAAAARDNAAAESRVAPSAPDSAPAESTVAPPSPLLARANAPDAPALLDWYTVHASATRVWIGGEGGHILMRRADANDAAWTPLPNPWAAPGAPTAASSDDPNARSITALFTLDDTTLLAATHAGYLFAWDGSTWRVESAHATEPGAAFGDAIFAIDGLDNELWMAGAHGKIWHRIAGAWQEETITTPDEGMLTPDTTWRAIRVVRDAHGDTAPTRTTVWLVGDHGSIAKRAPQLALPNAADSNAPLLQAPQYRWQLGTLPAHTDLRAVWGGVGTVAIGDTAGKVWCGADHLTVCGDFGRTHAILGIAGATDAELTVVGTGGLLAERNGETWREFPLPFPASVTGVASRAQTIVACGFNGAIYALNGAVVGMQQTTRAELTHPEWIMTTWRTDTGAPDDFFVAGDHLALAHARNDADGGMQWTVLYSDPNLIPFTTEASASPAWRELHVRGTQLIATGTAPYLLQRDATNGVIAAAHMPRPLAITRAAPPAPPAFAPIQLIGHGEAKAFTERGAQ